MGWVCWQGQLRTLWCSQVSSSLSLGGLCAPHGCLVSAAGKAALVRLWEAGPGMLGSSSFKRRDSSLGVKEERGDGAELKEWCQPCQSELHLSAPAPVMSQRSATETFACSVTEVLSLQSQPPSPYPLPQCQSFSTRPLSSFQFPPLSPCLNRAHGFAGTSPTGQRCQAGCHFCAPVKDIQRQTWLLGCKSSLTTSPKCALSKWRPG